MRAARRILAALLVLSAGGCIGGGDSIEAIYTLDAPQAPRVGAGTSSQLLVPEPRAIGALDTEKIAVRPTAATLAYYPAVAWPDTAPKVLQAILLETFQNTGNVRAVGLPGQSLLINYQIVTEVRAFQAETFGGDRAKVSVAVKILDDSNGRVVADRIFTARAPMAGDGPEDAAAALNVAVQQVALEVVSWTLTRI
jgi:cholesterol transport system auxiliary component